MKRVLIFIATFVFMYLLWSFVIWDLNPSNWEVHSRGSFAFFGTLTSALICSSPFIK